MTEMLLDVLSAAAEIVCPDTDLVARDEWLELRRTGLGGSDAAAALGLSPYTSPLALYLDKVDPQPDEDKEIFEAGRRAEPLILKWFADQTALSVERHAIMLRSRRWNWMLANLDGFVIEKDGSLSIVEAKNVGVYNADQWLDGPPIHVRLQGMHYLAVTGLNRCYFAALIGGNKFIYFCVERDQELIESMIAGEEKLWTLVTMRRMPEADGSESTKAALKAHYAKADLESIEVPDEFVTLIEQRALAKAVVKIDTERLTEIENRMIVLMDGAEVAMHEGDVVAKWQIVKKNGYTVDASEHRQWSVPKKKGK